MISRRLPAERGWAWFKEAWKLFKGAPGVWFGMGILIFLIMLGGEFLSVIGGAISSILEPILLVGLYLGCREQASGGRPKLGHLFEGFKGGHVVPLAALGALDFALSEGLSRLGRAILLEGAEWSELLKAQFWREFFASAAPAEVVKFCAVGALGTALYLVLGAAFWFAPALIGLGARKPLPAMKESLTAVFQNISAMVVYFLAAMGFAILASVPFYLGLLVFLPVFLMTVYVSYQDVFKQDLPHP